MEAREAEKEKKYEDTLEGPRKDGWEPVLYTLVLGTLGEISSTAVATLGEMGVRGPELDKLLDDLHRLYSVQAYNLNPSLVNAVYLLTFYGISARLVVRFPLHVHGFVFGSLSIVKGPPAAPRLWACCTNCALQGIPSQLASCTQSQSPLCPPARAQTCGPSSPSPNPAGPVVFRIRSLKKNHLSGLALGEGASADAIHERRCSNLRKQLSLLLRATY
eukprot:1191840-Prorocentrum_minimum.AAC.1